MRACVRAHVHIKIIWRKIFYKGIFMLNTIVISRIVFNYLISLE